MVLASGNIPQALGGLTAGTMTQPLQAAGLQAGANFSEALARQRGMAAAQAATALAGNSATPAPPSNSAASTRLNNHNNNPPMTAEELHAKAHKAAAGLVANALILPVLKQLRHDPFGKNTIFSPGTGEKTFGPEFDMQIADRIAQSPNMAATQVLTQRLESRGKPQGQNKVERLGVDVHG